MITDPLRLGRTFTRALHLGSNRHALKRPGHLKPAYTAPRSPDAFSPQPCVVRHGDAFIARHQQLFLSAALRHDARAELLERRERLAPATRHRRMATLLRAYAQPTEIERLPLISRPGPKSDLVVGSVHPAMVTFLEGAAEEFFKAYYDDGAMQSGADLLAAFKRANFHRIYIARLLEIDGLLSAGRATSVAEATITRRYGSHAL